MLACRRPNESHSGPSLLPIGFLDGLCLPWPTAPEKMDGDSAAETGCAGGVADCWGHHPQAPPQRQSQLVTLSGRKNVSNMRPGRVAVVHGLRTRVRGGCECLVPLFLGAPLKRSSLESCRRTRRRVAEGNEEQAGRNGSAQGVPVPFGNRAIRARLQLVCSLAAQMLPRRLWKRHRLCIRPIGQF